MNRWLLLLIALLSLQGCAATQLAIEKKDLKIDTIMSQSVFLDVENPPERSVFIAIKNTSGREFDIAAPIADRLREKGYALAAAPRDAGYLLQINILHVGEADPIALRQSVFGGYGGTLAMAAVGAGAGAMMGGGAKSRGNNALIGALSGGAAEVIAGSFVKDVTISVLTDVQVTERIPAAAAKTSPAVKPGRPGAAEAAAPSAAALPTDAQPTRHQTRIAQTANQVNLKYDEAMPPLRAGLVDSLSGIF